MLNLTVNWLRISKWIDQNNQTSDGFLLLVMYFEKVDLPKTAIDPQKIKRLWASISYSIFLISYIVENGKCNKIALLSKPVITIGVVTVLFISVVAVVFVILPGGGASPRNSWEVWWCVHNWKHKGSARGVGSPGEQSNSAKWYKSGLFFVHFWKNSRPK